MGHNEISPSHEILSQSRDSRSRSSSPSGDRKRVWQYNREYGFTASGGADEWVDTKQSSNFDKERQHEELAKPSLWEKIAPSTRGNEEQHDDLATPSMWWSGHGPYGYENYQGGQRRQGWLEGPGYQRWLEGQPWQGSNYQGYSDHQEGQERQSSCGQEMRERDESLGFHPYFNKRYPCDLLPGKTRPEHISITNGCLVAATWYLARDQGLPVSANQVAEALGHVGDKPVSESNVPSALQKLESKIPYGVETLSFEELTERLDNDNHSIIAIIERDATEEIRENREKTIKAHAVLVDKIVKAQINGQYETCVVVRDNENVCPWMVTKEDWEKTWAPERTIAPINTNLPSEGQSSSDSEEPSSHGRESSNDSEESTRYQHQDQLLTAITKYWDSLSACAKRECIAYHQDKLKKISSDRKRQYDKISQYMDYIIRL